MSRMIRWVALLFLVACDSKPPAPEAPMEIPAQGRSAGKDDFEKDNPAWEFAAGRWSRRGGVLVQEATDQVYAVALLKEKRFSDIDATVRFKPVSGKVDASGGLIFRATDARNYYVVRANALEDNFRLYANVDGKRQQIAGASIAPPALAEWHTLRVVAVDRRIQAYLNGRLLIDHEDARFSTGCIGLWTKEDSVTEFDDLSFTGISTH